MNEMPYKSLEKEIDELNKKVNVLEERINKGAERLVIVEQSVKSSHHRLDERKEDRDILVRLTTTMEHIIEKMQTLIEQGETYRHENETWHKEQEEKINNIKNKPANIALDAWTLVITAAITAAIGAVVAIMLA